MVKTVGWIMDAVGAVALAVALAAYFTGLAAMPDGGDDLGEWDTEHYAAWAEGV